MTYRLDGDLASLGIITAEDRLLIKNTLFPNEKPDANAIKGALEAGLYVQHAGVKYELTAEGALLAVRVDAGPSDWDAGLPPSKQWD